MCVCVRIPDVSSHIISLHVCVFCPSSDLVLKPVIWLAWCPHLNLAPRGTVGRSWGTWEHKKGDLKVQALTHIDFGWVSGVNFNNLSRTVDPNRYIHAHARFQVAFQNDF